MGLYLHEHPFSILIHDAGTNRSGAEDITCKSKEASPNLVAYM